MGRNYTVKFYGKPRNIKKNWLSNPEDAAFYNSSPWRKLSKWHKMNFPVCCIQGCTQPTAFSDHVIPISEGGETLDPDNLQPLCVRHNASKTGKQKKKTKFKS